MATRFVRALARVGSAMRDFGIASWGVMPALRSSDGTYGRQSVQSRARAKYRRRQYPS